jgi:hypothetical protein
MAAKASLNLLRRPGFHKPGSDLFGGWNAAVVL